jgi:hypothetical protein
MKANEKYKELTRTTARLPKGIYEKIENQSNENRRSINDELIIILNEYFDDSFVKLDTAIKIAVAKFAEAKGLTITAATNYLVSTKISVFEWIEDIIKEEADKAYEEEISEYKKQTGE